MMILMLLIIIVIIIYYSEQREREYLVFYFARGTNEYNFAKNADSPTPFIDSLY